MNREVEVTDITWGFLVKPPAQGPSKDYLLVEADYLPCELMQFVDVATESSQSMRHVVFFTFGYGLSAGDWQSIEQGFRKARPQSLFVFADSGEYRNITAFTRDSGREADIAVAVAAVHNSGTLDDPASVTVRVGDTDLLVEPPADMTMLGTYKVSSRSG